MKKTVKIYISFKDLPLLIDKLETNDIPYNLDQKQVNSVYRFDFLEIDRLIIDKIIRENNINSNIEGYPINEFLSEKKFMVLFIYLGIPAIVFIILMLLINSVK